MGDVRAPIAGRSTMHRQAGVAYGLELRGPTLGAWLPAAGTERFPAVTIRQDSESLPERPRIVGEDAAHLPLADGTHAVSLDRNRAAAVYYGPALSDDQLVHPYLWPVASVFARWHGREAFHAGAVIVAGGAWAVLGPKEAGKSTLLAACAAAGASVLSDDLVVVDGTAAFAGPRCLDLRSPPPKAMADRLTVTPARGSSRWRVALSPTGTTAQLCGWVFLTWGEQLELPAVPVSTNLRWLAAWRAWRQLPSDPAHMLALAGLPAYTLTRPRAMEHLAVTVEMLLGALEHAGAGGR